MNHKKQYSKPCFHQQNQYSYKYYLGHCTLHCKVRLSNGVSTLEDFVHVVCIGKRDKTKSTVPLLAIGSILWNVSILRDDKLLSHV